MGINMLKEHFLPCLQQIQSQIRKPRSKREMHFSCNKVHSPNKVTWPQCIFTIGHSKSCGQEKQDLLQTEQSKRRRRSTFFTLCSKWVKWWIPISFQTTRRWERSRSLIPIMWNVTLILCLERINFVRFKPINWWPDPAPQTTIMDSIKGNPVSSSSWIRLDLTYNTLFKASIDCLHHSKKTSVHIIHLLLNCQVWKWHGNAKHLPVSDKIH